MAKPSLNLALIFKFLLLCVLSSPCSSSRHHRTTRSRAYIISQCRTTRYPQLCVKCLSNFPNLNVQNPQQLAQIALKVSLYRAEITKSYIIKVTKELEEIKAKDYPAVKDCSAQINDSVSQLTQSIREVKEFAKENQSDEDLAWHISNIDSWATAAMTDANMCLDQFPGSRMSKMKATIKGKVLNVEQVTSNALALFHHYAAARYKARAAKKQKP